MPNDAIDQAAAAFMATMQEPSTAKPQRAARREGSDKIEAEPPERMFDPEDTTNEIIEHDDDDDDDRGEHATYTPEGEEDEEGEGESEGENEEEGTAEERPTLESKFNVTVDGKQQQVTLKDALEGYIRTQTFHQRMNEVSEARKIVEREAGEVAQARGVYKDMLTTLAQQLDSLVPPEPDWDKEFNADPIQALQKQHLWDKFRSQRATIDQERARVDQEQQQENAKQFQKYVEQERKLLADKHPQWTDPEKGQKNWERDKAAMDKTARAAGFTEQEIGSIFDHRMIVILNKAAQYDRIKASQPKPINDGKKPARPGSGASRTGQSGNSREARRLAQSGSISDATALFHRIINSE